MLIADLNVELKLFSAKRQRIFVDYLLTSKIRNVFDPHGSHQACPDFLSHIIGPGCRINGQAALLSKILQQINQHQVFQPLGLVVNLPEHSIPCLPILCRSL